MPRLKPAGGMPVGVNLTCEICGLARSTPDNVYCISVQYNMPGPRGSSGSYPAFQCSQIQHFACSETHAVLAAIACLLEHLLANPARAANGKTNTDATIAALQAALEQATIVQGGGGV